MRTAGVDLASQARNTATCVVDWERGRVESLEVGIGDEAIVALLREGMPPGLDASVIAREGRIHVPREGSLGVLHADAP